MKNVIIPPLEESCTMHSPFTKGARGILPPLMCLLFVISFSCSSVNHSRIRQDFVNFCDLPEYEGDTVWVTASYSGIEEYWGLNGRGCDNLSVELGYRNWFELGDELDSLFSKVHDEYYMYNLKLEVKGVFEKGNYGHLGSNNGLFSVIEFGKVELKRIRLK